MKIAHIVEMSYSMLPEIIPAAQQQLDRYRKSGDPADFTAFMDIVKRLGDEPALHGVPMVHREMDRDHLKILHGYLGMLLNAHHKGQLQRDYGVVLGMLQALQHHVGQGWSPRDAGKGKTIMVQLMDNGVLGLHWAGDRKWVEVRGRSYWQYDPADPLHQLIDQITGNKSDLMNGVEIAISPNYREYKILANLLRS